MNNFEDRINTVVCGDAMTVMATIPDAVFQAVITSPPYWGLRNYETEPIVWNGDPECEHVWGESLELHDVREETTHGKTRTTDRFYGDKSRRFDGNHQKHTSGKFCSSCAAWLGSLGLEPTPELYVSHLVQIFREVWRVLRNDGTLWLNIGDSYWGGKGKSGYELPHEAEERREKGETIQHGYQVPGYRDMRPSDGSHPVLKPKDLVLIPFRLALALQADGWWIRSDIVWHKPNPMPESVTDRPTKAHEYVFLCSKSKKYYYDSDAIRESNANPKRTNYAPGPRAYAEGNTEQCNDSRTRRNNGFEAYAKGKVCIGRNKRTVWTVNTQPSSIEHYASFPEKLITPMILAGSSHKACQHCGTPWVQVREKVGKFQRRWSKNNANGSPYNKQSSMQYANAGRIPTCSCPDNNGSGKSVVFDPFMGAGTVGVVATELGRDYFGCDNNPEYVKMAETRIKGTQPGLPL